MNLVDRILPLVAATLLCAATACDGRPFAVACVGDAGCPADAMAIPDAQVDSDAATVEGSSPEEAGLLDDADDGEGSLSMDATAPDADVPDGAWADAAADTEAGPCDPFQDPQKEPCLLDEAYGIFVSTSGLPNDNGSRSYPVPTIAEGIQKAANTGRSRVFVCQGQYAESVVLDAAHDGISLYGGFTCVGGWHPGGLPAEIHSPTSPFALRVDSLAHPISIEDFSLTAPDDTTGTGSIAALVHASNVTFLRVTLAAGQGARGSDGRPGSAMPNYLTPTAPAGLAGTPFAAGQGGLSTCALFGSSAGGAGGYQNGVDSSGVYITTAAASGSATPAATPAPRQDGLGAGCAALGCPGLTGNPGARGAAGPPAQASTNPGSLWTAGWTPAAGAAGPFGNPGQGGGGGGADCTYSGLTCYSIEDLFGGNGGGAGGCGGSGGQGGGQGSPSIGLLSLDATVLLADSKLQTQSGGDGGSGGAGEDGQAGGFSPSQIKIGARTGYAGGQGGAGAGGGGGAGGNGGPSIGVAYHGAQPTLNNTPITLGAGGKPGPGGTGGAGSGSPGPSGSAGKASFAIHALAL